MFKPFKVKSEIGVCCQTGCENPPVMFFFHWDTDVAVRITILFVCEEHKEELLLAFAAHPAYEILLKKKIGD